jgi:hypothetical protein
VTRQRHRRLLILTAATAVFVQVCSMISSTAWGLSFNTAPALPAMPTITLNAGAQISHAQMNNFEVSDLLGGGWNVTVAGNTAAGKSPTFAQYCPKSGGCGADALGYIPGGKKLPANSLTLNTAGASFTTTLGGPATFTCNTTPCNVDASTPSKIATESTGTLLASWTSMGFSATSLALSTATTLKVLPASEVYRVDIVWTLNTGP